MEVLVVLAWAIVGIGCWIGYLLIKQNGRILLHLDSIEQQLVELRSHSPPTFAPPQTAPSMPAGLPIGTLAPSFALPNLSGLPRSLAEWRGQPLLLIFFNPGCGFCRQMAPDIAAMSTAARCRLSTCLCHALGLPANVGNSEHRVSGAVDERKFICIAMVNLSACELFIRFFANSFINSMA